LVRDGATAIQALAEATADGLEAAGGLVAVKHALFTGTQTNSTTAGGNFAVDDLSITHTLADAANKLIISAYFGVAGTSDGRGNVGIAVADNGTLIGRGAADGNRTRVGAGGRTIGGAARDEQIAVFPSVSFVYEPGDVNSHTYTVRGINIFNATATLYINRTESDSNDFFVPRGASALVIQEVKV
jgi:hypothetical protein